MIWTAAMPLKTPMLLTGLKGWRGRGPVAILAGVLVTSLLGCSSPPSAVPLMKVAQQAMQQEARHLAEGKKRADALLKERQQALQAGFKADLKARDALTKQWVREGTAGYVAARESLLRQHLRRTQQHTQRIDNLKAASRAQQRAIDLLQRQDQLLTQTLGGDLWDLRRLLEDEAR